MKTIHVGCDHAGFDLKEKLKTWLAGSYDVADHGTYSAESVDYPDFAHAVAKAVESGDGQGILICGSANGVAMAANKHAEIRAAICWQREIAVLARSHNNANILCIPARFVSVEEAMEITKAFMETSFEGGRHQRRVEKIACI